jgi:hypothetical protein
MAKCQKPPKPIKPYVGGHAAETAQVKPVSLQVGSSIKNHVGKVPARSGASIDIVA